MKDLRVSMVQVSLFWEQKAKNLESLSRKILSENLQTDLLILPEMFTTGFSMNSGNLAESMDGQTMEWMQLHARTLNAIICGSFIAVDGGKYFNRLVWMQPDGNYQHYDKKHLFTLAGEDKHFSSGNDKLICECNGWKIQPLICYDLRFPVWCRNTHEYDLMIFVANWPEKRNYAWKTLLKARAIENQAYVIGVNRVGKDDNDLTYSGDSTAIDFSGRRLYQKSGSEGIHTVELSYEKLSDFRATFKFLQDRDEFSIKKVQGKR